MNKKIIFAASLFLIVSIATIIVLVSNKNENGLPNPLPENGNAVQDTSVADGKTILFYGDGCPHCLKIEAFLEEKEAVRKISYETKEVWNDADNRTLMMEKVAICKIKQDSVGVPFLWDGKNGKCLIGVDQVMEFFQAKLDEADK